MYFRDGNYGVRGLGEGGLEEARICPCKYAYVVRVESDMDDLLMVEACIENRGGELDLNWCVDGSKHAIWLGVCQRDEEVGQM